MSTGSWLRTHRKQVITHTLIVGGFLLFLFFLAEPFFDRPEAVQGESKLYDFPLPAETKGITYYFDEFVTDGRTIVEIRGWAFIWGQDSVDSGKYIVLKSADRTYVFTTETVLREGVTQHFKELDLNLDYSGFAALIPAREIADGDYTVGICITKGDIEALIYTNRAIRKSGDTIKTG